MNERVTRFKALMEQCSRQDVMIAFSGGVDSSLLLKVACDAARERGTKVYAVTIQTFLQPLKEGEQAKAIAEKEGAEHLVIRSEELEEIGIMKNPVNRCYLCKKHLFGLIKSKALELGVSIVMEGTNEDDLHVYRPGIQAIGELGILSPLAECGMKKDDIRALAAEYGISTARKPAAPCMATRFPYGTHLTVEKIRQVEQAEAYIKTCGISQVRVRMHDDIVRIEADEDGMEILLKNREEIISYLKELGYVYITLDLEGFRSGSMDYYIENKKLP